MELEGGGRDARGGVHFSVASSEQALLLRRGIQTQPYPLPPCRETKNIRKVLRCLLTCAALAPSTCPCCRRWLGFVSDPSDNAYMQYRCPRSVCDRWVRASFSGWELPYIPEFSYRDASEGTAAAAMAFPNQVMFYSRLPDLLLTHPFSASVCHAAIWIRQIVKGEKQDSKDQRRYMKHSWRRGYLHRVF